MNENGLHRYIVNDHLAASVSKLVRNTTDISKTTNHRSKLLIYMIIVTLGIDKALSTLLSTIKTSQLLK